MAVSLPTSSLKLNQNYWASQQAIRSGSVTADRAVGTRGLIEETHHAYAYSTRAIASDWRPNLLYNTDGTNFETFGEVSFRTSADMLGLKVVAWLTETILQVNIYARTSVLLTVQSSPEAVVTDTDSLPTPGYDELIYLDIEAKRFAATPGTIKGYTVYLTEMTVGQLP